MVDASTPRVTVEPPLGDWRLADGARRDGRCELASALDTLGLHDTRFDPDRPVIATGHQAWFWHPGILTKDLAMAEACDRLGAQPVHLVVDHIATAALSIDVPVRRGDALVVEPLRLGREDLAIGTASRPPLSAEGLRDAVERFEREVDGELLADLSVLLDLPEGFDRLGSVADSITAMQLHAVRNWCPGVFVLRTSELARLGAFGTLGSRMLHDARRCVALYNESVARVPQANIAPLLVERDRVELPLWVVEPAGSLGSVFADLADTTPLLTREDGTPILPVVTDGVEHLPFAPKALTLTAFLRSAVCDLFIHGTGGGVYEQVTERWWRAWVGGTAVSTVGARDGQDACPAGLAPLAVVSADVRLIIDAPVATPDELDRAVWFRHHLPHNIDRYLEKVGVADAPLINEKKVLIAGADGDHDKQARRAARRRLHAINRQLAGHHPGLLAEADAAVVAARQGLANAAVAARRDWCFSLYPADTLAKLRPRVAGPA